MKQEIVKSVNALANMGANVIGGLTQYEVALNIVHVPKVKVQTDLVALLTGNDAFQAGRVLLSDKRDAVRSLAKQGRDLIILTRDMLKPRFGSQFSSAWEILGFQGSLEAPASAEDVKPILRAIQSYLAANPTLEVAALGITAAAAQTLFDDLTAAIVAVNMQDSALGVLRDTRDAAMDTFYATLRGLVDELALRMGPMDQRWIAFGFNLPGAQATPDTPEGLKAALIGPTAVALKWDAAARAEYYRVYKKVQGVDEDFVAVGSPADLDFTIEGLPTNSTVEIQISAVNNGGESSRTASVTIVTHA